MLKGIKSWDQRYGQRNSFLCVCVSVFLSTRKQASVNVMQRVVCVWCVEVAESECLQKRLKTANHLMLCTRKLAIQIHWQQTYPIEPNFHIWKHGHTYIVWYSVNCWFICILLLKSVFHRFVNLFCGNSSVWFGTVQHIKDWNSAKITLAIVKEQIQTFEVVFDVKQQTSNRSTT